MPEEKAKSNFDETKLSKEKLEFFRFVKGRIEDLKEARKDQYGMNIEKIWADADKDYVPHRLGTKGKRVIATDEEKGWRGATVTLGSSDWQSDISQPNIFIKIQIALSILIDQNPTGVFSAASKKFQATTELIKQLYNRSWEQAKSKTQLKLFVFNLAKYGWAVARTYPLRITRKVKSIVEYNQEDPEKSEWEEKEVVEYNDIFRENIDPWNAWIDDMAKPNNQFSMRDWCWRKVYAFDQAEEEFGKYPNWKLVQPGGITTEKVDGMASTEKKYKERKLVEVYFYENRIKDLFMVLANGVPVIIEPLPISDATGLKKLSCWQAYWALRHAECPYGIGIYESVRYDQGIIDRLRNMTIDQLTLSIYKMFFYQGTQSLTDTGDIKIAPGVGKQTLDPKNITWLDVPGPGKEAWEGIQMFKHDLDESSGITDPLMGVVTGKTAFEVAQAKESALKRLKNPLENITDALQTEGYITISLIQLIYSVPETFAITDPILIDDYLKEIQSDSELYERDEQGTFIAKVFPEFPLNLDKDEKGNLIETKDTRFFRIKPRFLRWEGILSVKPQSVLTPSKQVDKALGMEFYNVFSPLVAQLMQEFDLAMQSGQPATLDVLPHGKLAKDLCKLYDRDPRDLLPDQWFEENKPEMPLIVPQQVIAQAQQQALQPPQPQQGAQRAGAPVQFPPQQPQGIVQKVMSALNPFGR